MGKVLEALFSEDGMTYFIPSTSTGISVIVAVPFFGWLADAKLGNYKVVKIGVAVSWTVGFCTTEFVQFVELQHLLVQ